MKGRLLQAVEGGKASMRVGEVESQVAGCTRG